MIPLLSEQARRWLAVAEGLPQDQIQARAVDAAKTGMLSFADALAIKAMADQVTSSNAGMGVPAPTNTVMGEAMQQLQSGIVGQSVPPSLAGDASNSGLAALAAAQPPAPPSDGIAGLDISPEMFDAPKNMAAGGIVAFAEGGQPTSIPWEESFVGRTWRGVPEFFGNVFERMGNTSYDQAVMNANVAAGLFGGTVYPYSGEQSDMGEPAAETPAAAPSGPTPMAEKFAPLLRSGLTPGQLGLLGYSPTYPAPAPPTSPMPSEAPAAAPTQSPFSLATLGKGIEAPSEAPSEAAIRAGVDKSYEGVDAAMRRAMDYFEGQQKSLAQEGAEDRRMAAAMAGFKMAEAAGRPGGTFLGSAAAGGAQYAEDINKSRKDLTDKKAGLEKAGLDLALAKAELDVKKDETTRARVDKTQERYDQRLRDAADAQFKQMSMQIALGELSLKELEAGVQKSLIALVGVVNNPKSTKEQREDARRQIDIINQVYSPAEMAKVNYYLQLQEQSAAEARIEAAKTLQDMGYFDWRRQLEDLNPRDPEYTRIQNVLKDMMDLVSVSETGGPAGNRGLTYKDGKILPVGE